LLRLSLRRKTLLRLVSSCNNMIRARRRRVLRVNLAGR
jgi:hypothetical protein